ncbi:hypothetical protein QOT17_010631 [Balamuthia mandrillaris]
MSKKVKVPASRSDILRLYKSLFRAAEQMPTVNREMWVKEKARRDFKLNKDLTDEEDIQTVMAVGLTHLDSVRIQAAHLTRVFNTDWEADLAKTLRKPQHADPDIYSSKK